MKKLILTVSALVSFASIQGFASDDQKPKDKQLNQGPQQKLTFEDLKEACENPARFHNQVAPSNIQISCSELKSKWVNESKAGVPLPVKRMITTSVISNKYTTAPTLGQPEMAPQVMPCEKLKEVLESVETVQASSCEHLLAFKGTGEEYCSTAIDALRISNPEATKVKDSGRKADFCDVKIQE